MCERCESIVQPELQRLHGTGNCHAMHHLQEGIEETVRNLCRDPFHVVTGKTLFEKLVYMKRLVECHKLPINELRKNMAEISAVTNVKNERKQWKKHFTVYLNTKAGRNEASSWRSHPTSVADRSDTYEAPSVDASFAPWRKRQCR